ncbi:LOW QUALITY PROTEIN: hypothetical protein QYF61_022507 [Mycteria americana]|uniref:Uncharacterized protein n=1 Tax=Mycteria americana TaxID=33587 RepID=A0AAN7NH99_MYCAM|nr:LOW QUALITY PROTEIN: hypothetical protein QYF61_022507 [Mycteria americana]
MGQPAVPALRAQCVPGGSVTEHWPWGPAPGKEGTAGAKRPCCHLGLSDSSPHQHKSEGDLVEEVPMAGPGWWTSRWLKSWLDDRAQTFTVNALYSSQRTVTNEVLQGFILRLVLFNIFINDPEEVMQGTHQVTNWGGRVLPEGRAAIQRGHGRLKACANRSIMDLGREVPCQQSRLGPGCLGNSSGEETLGVLVCSELRQSQQWALAAGMAISIWAVLTEAQPVEIGHPVLGPPIDNFERLKQVQWRPPRWSGLEHLLCEERLRELGLFSLEMRRLQGDLTAAPVPVEGYQGVGARTFYSNAWQEEREMDKN